MDSLQSHHLCRRQSPTARCPSEMLSLIFQAVLEMMYSGPPSILLPGDTQENRYTVLRRSILALAAVCVRWRHIAFSTPQLWTAITIGVSPATELKRTAYLHLCFENAKCLPLDLEVSFTHFSSDKPPCALLNLILSNAHNIKILRLIDPPSVLLPLLNSSFPNMTGISLSSVFRRLPVPSLVGACALDWITIKNTTNLEFLGCRVTHLNLEVVPVDICVKLIFQCSNLIEYHSRYPEPPTPNPAGLANKVVLNHLKIFGWSCSKWCYNWDSVIFDRLHLPSIRELVIFGVYAREDDNIHVDEFMTRISGTLSKLYIRRFYHCFWESIFARPNLIGHLALIDCSPEYILRTLSALTRYQGPHGTGRKYYPNLRSFSLIAKEYSMNAKIWLAPLIVAFLEARTGSAFSLQLIGIGIRWDTEEADKIRLMLQENSDLEVID